MEQVDTVSAGLGRCVGVTRSSGIENKNKPIGFNTGEVYGRMAAAASVNGTSAYSRSGGNYGTCTRHS